MRKVLAPILVVIFLVSFSSSLFALTAGQVIKNIHNFSERQWSKVNDLTIVVPMGTSYIKKTKIEGKVVYKTRTEMMGNVTIYDGVYQWSIDPMTGKPKKEKVEYDPRQTWSWGNLKAENAQHGGMDNVGGKKAHKLIIKDMFEAMGTSAMLPKGMGELKAKGKIWVDAKNWVVLKMQTTSEYGGRKTTTTTEWKDYRKVKGMLIPYTAVTKTDMPDFPGQESEINIQEVKVNTGLSGDLFDGTKLKPGKPMYQIPRQY
jgi:outer membrane lipoprotein-sorting protein